MKHKIICGDCIEVMKDFKNKSIDMILCDLPYGTTACSWDTIIPFEPLWEQYKRIIKDNGAIVLFGSEPFSSELRISNLKDYKYDWIWEKEQGSNFFMSNKQPMKNYENIMVFYMHQPTYNPLMVNVGRTWKKNDSGNNIIKHLNVKEKAIKRKSKGNLRYPLAVQKFTRIRDGLHPTQKPVALFEYLIKTYTNENDVILDNCVGSGTTLIASERLGRNSIGIEISKEYCELSYQRLLKEVQQQKWNQELSTIEKIGF